MRERLKATADQEWLEKMADAEDKVDGGLTAGSMSAPRLDPERRQEFVEAVDRVVDLWSDEERRCMSELVERIWQAGYARGFVDRDDFIPLGPEAAFERYDWAKNKVLNQD